MLSTMALASPAICAYRMYRHYTPDGTVPPHMPSQVAKVFMNRMNTPEATAVIAQCYGESDDPGQADQHAVHLGGQRAVDA